MNSPPLVGGGDELGVDPPSDGVDDGADDPPSGEPDWALVAAVATVGDAAEEPPGEPVVPSNPNSSAGSASSARFVFRRCSGWRRSGEDGVEVTVGSRLATVTGIGVGVGALGARLRSCDERAGLWRCWSAPRPSSCTIRTGSGKTPVATQ
jgi:hypothetical protein